MGQENRLHSLTGLRFAAVFLVFAQHIQGHFGIPNLGLNFGHEATALFFVLSGFVLTYAYKDRLQEPGKLRHFYFSRWTRMWPLHAVGLIAATFLLASQAEFLSQPDWPALILANLTLLQSWVPAENWALSFNSVSWFLSVLVFCYAIFPLLVSGDSKRVWLILGTWLAVLTVALLVLANLLPASWNNVEVAIVMFHPLVRCVDFMLGVAIGILFLESREQPSLQSTPRFRTEDEEATTGQFVEGTGIDDLKVIQSSRNNRRTVSDYDDETEISSPDTMLEFLALVLVGGYLASLFFLRWDLQLSNAPAIGPMLGIWIRSLSALILSAATLWALAGRSGAISVLLSSPPAQYLGAITFAFYITHQLVIRFLMYFGWNTQIPAIVVAFLLLLMCLAVAMLAHHLLEKPLRILLERLEQRCNRDDLPANVAVAEAMLACQESGHTFVSGLLTPTALVSVAMLLFTGVAVYGAHSPTQVAQEKQFVARPFFGKAAIEFEEEATLLGLQASRNDEGVQLVMFWKRHPTAKRNRSFHLIDGQDKILGYATQDQTAFMAKAPGLEFKEVLLIPDDALGQAAKIGIGFFHPEHKGAAINRGPRSMNGRRLDIELSKVFAE